jgi:inward rectifier potassium channel
MMMSKRTKPPRNGEDQTKDLGFGTRVLEQSHERFLNRDGTFNVTRTGFSFFRSLSVYHFLLTISWGQFLSLLIGFYFSVNLLFAFGYYLCGPGALAGSHAVTLGERFQESFFFSVQTLATIGYGGLSPAGLAPNLLVTIQALVGGLGIALATGLVFARFSRPNAKIIFSEKAVIAPYRGITAFEFRIVNAKNNQIVNVQATVMLSRLEEHQGRTLRRFHKLALERDDVSFFPLHWVIVHPIDESSPLYGATARELIDVDAEFIILLTGVDETSSQSVHVRSSYKHDEVVWGSKFADMFTTSSGEIAVDLRKLHDIQPAE